MSDQANQSVPVEITLQRYETVMAHLRYDQEMFWTRFGFMLVGEVAALGFFVTIFVESIKDPKLPTSPAVVASLLGFCTVGVVIAWLFDRLRRITARWIDRWLDILKGLEPTAFGDTVLFRTPADPRSARHSALHFMLFFVVLWVFLAAIVVLRAFTT